MTDFISSSLYLSILSPSAPLAQQRSWDYKRSLRLQIAFPTATAFFRLGALGTSRSQKFHPPSGSGSISLLQLRMAPAMSNGYLSVIRSPRSYWLELVLCFLSLISLKGLGPRVSNITAFPLSNNPLFRQASMAMASCCLDAKKMDQGGWINDLMSNGWWVQGVWVPLHRKRTLAEGIVWVESCVQINY